VQERYRRRTGATAEFTFAKNEISTWLQCIIFYRWRNIGYYTPNCVLLRVTVRFQLLQVSSAGHNKKAIRWLSTITKGHVTQRYQAVQCTPCHMMLSTHTHTHTQRQTAGIHGSISGHPLTANIKQLIGLRINSIYVYCNDPIHHHSSLTSLLCSDYL